MALFYCWSIKSNPHFILRRSNAMEKLGFTITLVRNNRKRRKKLRTKQKSNVILLSTTRIIYVIDNTTPVLCYSNLKFVYTKDFFSNHQINLTRIKKNQLEIEPKATAVSKSKTLKQVSLTFHLSLFRFVLMALARKQSYLQAKLTRLL